MRDDTPYVTALLVLPHLRIQNANAISSPLTWGFPSMTAFVGLAQALERRLAGELKLEFLSVGVVCHHFQAQASRNGYTQAFHLTRNPVNKDGDTAAIVEEGRIHLDVTLVFGIAGDDAGGRDAEHHANVAQRVGEVVSGMRVAGGSVMPALPGKRRRTTPYLAIRPSDGEDDRAFRQLRRQWLPGFALVSRDDLLAEHLATLRQRRPDASMLDAWLDVTRLNVRADQDVKTDAVTGDTSTAVEWRVERPPGWIVPIPVGYGALSDLHPPGTVAGARDRRVPFCFVESLYSLGQWVSPHRLRDVDDLLWFTHTDHEAGLYRCINRYQGGHALPASLNND
jgi:CRISPR-associated protein Csy2